MKFRKKPVEVEAFRWLKNGDHPDDDSVRIADNGEEYLTEGKIVRYYRSPGDGYKKCKHCGLAMHYHGWIDTLEGGHIVCRGDYIITGVKGEHYPCKPEIFHETYEAVQQ